VLDWGRKYALFNLKTLIRGKLYDLDQKEIRDNLYVLPEHMRLSEEVSTELFRAENVLELLRQLEAGDTSHPRPPGARGLRAAARALRLGGGDRSTLLRRAVATGHGVQRRNLDPLKRLIGAELDRINLMWLLRFRFSYQLSASETFYHLVPSMRLLTRERLLHLVNVETFEGVVATLPAPLDRLLAGSKNIVDVQKRIGAYAAQEAHWVLHRTQSGVARALAYLMLRERDLCCCSRWHRARS
jgi:V/A-type H+/Na+-transporting ATPase subunit C